MASTEEYLGCPEDLGDLPHPLEEVDQPPSMGTGNEVVNDSSTQEGRQVIDEEDETNCPATATIEFTRPMILLPLHRLLDIAHQKRCFSSFRCACQALRPPIPLVCMEYLPFAMNWTGGGIVYSIVPEMMLSRLRSRKYGASLRSCMRSVVLILLGIIDMMCIHVKLEDSFVLPLCSPCRGMYVQDRALLEVDLWIKDGGKESVDKLLLSAYAEIDIRAEYDYMLHVRIPNDDCNLDIKCMVLTRSVETVIQVYAKVDHPCHVRFTAFSTCYDDYEILIFDGKLLGDEKLFQHVITVKENGKLDVLLKLDQSLFQWTFQDKHIGAVCSPDDSIFAYGHFFVRVFFAPKDYQRNPPTTF
ncbi:hypothetical protein ACQ4PT_070674 [Festuca glaucescens]